MQQGASLWQPETTLEVFLQPRSGDLSLLRKHARGFHARFCARKRLFFSEFANSSSVILRTTTCGLCNSIRVFIGYESSR